MRVAIKDFQVEMEVKNNGIEFQVRDNDETLRGDCYLTRVGLIWCPGQTTRPRGKKVTWDQFIAWMESQ